MQVSIDVSIEQHSTEHHLHCRQCGHGWHGACVVPALVQRPGSGWQCPVCDHCDLVTALAATSAELLVLMERVEERRLAEMEVTVAVLPRPCSYNYPLFSGQSVHGS